ncbi:ATP-binding protein [Streptomyces sp. NPDC002659]|uniref:ATP-binding protein n=1 Tax=Streptomyces sp. NPDC002659 TaxID=3364656 RepID=UPI00367F6F59
MPTIRARFEGIAANALQERASYKDFLADLLEAECLQREERKKIRLVREANFPRPKRLEYLEFDKNPNVTPEQAGTLSDPAWVTAGLPLCLIGDSGTGKSHLLIGIGTAIAEAGMRVRYATTANLVNELAAAADEKKLGRTLARYGRVGLLCVDEFGYLDLDKAGAKLLFQEPFSRVDHECEEGCGDWRESVRAGAGVAEDPPLFDPCDRALERGP